MVGGRLFEGAFGCSIVDLMASGLGRVFDDVEFQGLLDEKIHTLPTFSFDRQALIHLQICSLKDMYMRSTRCTYLLATSKKGQ